MAAWEALLLPNWRWEAFEKEDEDGLYYGRVKSPLTYDSWEWGYFSEDQLKQAKAYRIDDDDELFPDGGYELTNLYETELAAIDDELEEGGYGSEI